MAWPSGMGISLAVMGWRSRPGRSGGRGASGGVAGGAPVVGRDVADDAVQFDGPGEGVQVVGEAQAATGVDGAPFAFARDRGRLAGLCDLEARVG